MELQKQVEERAHQDVAKHMEFVTEFFNRYKETVKLIYDDQILHTEVNKALGLYEEIAISLNTAYQAVVREEESVKKQFRRWYDKKFEEAKREVIQDYININRESKGAAVKPALKEFEVRIRTSNEEEYNYFEDIQEELHRKVRYIIRCINDFKKFDGLLVTLSQNLRQEMKSMSIEKRALSDPETVSQNRIRSEEAVRTRTGR
jgi:hypothetical protein